MEKGNSIIISTSKHCTGKFYYGVIDRWASRNEAQELQKETHKGTCRTH